MQLTIVLGLALLGPPTAPEVDTRQLADDLARSIRALQNEDGSYGSGLVDTCRVLDLLRRSPRRYNELDGPFIRRAAQWVLAAPSDGSLDDQGWRVLALADAVTPPLKAARDEALARLAGADDLAGSEVACLALRSTRPQEGTNWPAIPADAHPALACLLAEDPASVSPPGLDDLPAWVRWARAARLRGLRPALWPAIEPDADVSALGELCARFELVLAVHGLAKASPLPEQELPAVVEQPRPLREAIEHSLEWLESRQQEGTFGLGVPGWEGPEPGVTALCLSATIKACTHLGRPRPDWVDRGLDFLLSLQKPSGAIYDYGVAVYTTSVAMEALLDGGRPGDAAAIARALDYLVVVQSDEGEGYDSEDDPLYGGVGYGNDERPDLSNTQMAVEAAARAGLPKDHPFYHRALAFLQRNQNLGEVAALEWPRAAGGKVVSGTDGGATYMPGNSPAGEVQVGEEIWEARSYGSMTYALTKSYLLCGLPPDHPRVEAAVRWLVSHYTLDRNPGFADPDGGADGLYYYYLALGRTLSRLPEASLAAAAEGAAPPWRTDLERRLLSDQRIDGSWINARSPRWYEGSPTLCTAYALLALEATRAPASR